MAYQPKSYRKFLATSVAAAVVVTAAAPAALAAPADAKFSDVSSSHWAIKDINYLVEKGAIQGYPDGTFKPNNSITRAEIAVVLAKTLNLDVDPEVTTDKFSDVPATHWANPYIAAIVDQTEGVIDGYENGTFRPSNTITRQEMAKMVVEAYDLELVEGKDLPFTDVSGLWSTEYINILASNGVAAGMTATTFAPRGEVLRAQTAAFVHRAEVEGERIDVPDLELTVKSATVVDSRTLTVVLSNDTTHTVNLETALVANEATTVTFEIDGKEYSATVTYVVTDLAISSIDTVNPDRLVINFNKALDEDDIRDIERASNRFVVYDAAGSVVTRETQSRIITFNSNGTSATIILDNPLATGKAYTVALVDDLSVPSLSKVIASSPSTVLLPGINAPTTELGENQKDVVLNFNQKMNNATLTASNYSIYNSSNQLIQGASASPAILAGEWVDSTTQRSAKFEVKPGLFNAGQMYSVVVNSNVAAADGTALPVSQRTLSFSTPSISDATPKVSSVIATASNTIQVTFDKELLVNNGINPSLITVRQANGTAIPVSSATVVGGSKTLTITLETNSLEAGRNYSVSLPANIATNDIYRNASNVAVNDLAVVSASNVAATSLTTEFVRQSSDKTKADLLLKFDQPVNQILAADLNAGDIVINSLGGAYSILGTANVEAYANDASGKTLIIKDVTSAFNGFVPESGKTYEVVAKAGTIQTKTPASTPRTNTSDLKSTVAGIDVSAAAISKVNMVSENEITIKFNKNIDATNLQPGDVTVKGFIKSADGSVSNTTLTGANQLQISASGDTLTIKPATSAVKFQTGKVGADANATNFITVAGDKLKDSLGIVSGAYTVTFGDSKLEDNAAPVALVAGATNADNLNITYSENVQFRGGTSAQQASQFSVAGVANNTYSTAVSTLTNNILSLEFVGSFESGRDYSAATLNYTRNVNFQLQDLNGNAKNTGTITGLNGFTVAP